jgi:hypothetical protein
MKVTECAFILPNGQKCRAAANRNQTLCRHHAPAVSGPPPIRKSELYSRIRQWSHLGRRLPWLDKADIPIEIYGILLALLEDGDTGISDREAGRLLRGLLRRLGAIPFPMPDPVDPYAEKDAPSLSPAVPHPARRQSAGLSDLDALQQASHDPDQMMELLFALGQRELSRPKPAKPGVQQTRPGLQLARPPLTQTQPSTRQTQPTMQQTRPSYK